MPHSNKRKRQAWLDNSIAKRARRPESKTISLGEGYSQDALPDAPPISSELESVVFTHASVATQHPDDPKMVNYERLEFLGDAQIELMATLVVFERYSSATPGKMSAAREKLCRNDTLAQYCRDYHFDKRLKTSFQPGEITDWHKIQGDVFEAYVAAIVLSATNQNEGFETARAWLTKLWEPKLQSLGLSVPQDVRSKEELAKKVLAKGIKLSYVEDRPPIMNKHEGTETYFMGCYITGWGYQNQHLGSGHGRSKNEAGQNAAAYALSNRPLLSDIITKRLEYLEQKKAEEEAAAAANMADDAAPFKKESLGNGGLDGRNTLRNG